MQLSTETSQKVALIKTTILGGILFLLPIVAIIWLLGKALGFAKRLSDPIVRAAGVNTLAGAATGTLAAIGALVVISFIAGLLARTRLGQSAFSRLEGGVLSLFPQWRMARGLIQGFESEGHIDMEVVLVPTDAGWCLGFVLEKPEGEWWTVFVPSSPQCTSGGVSFAHVDQVKPTGLTPTQAILLLRRCGTGSAKIRALLSSLQDKGDL